jgi:hypothetical protein
MLQRSGEGGSPPATQLVLAAADRRQRPTKEGHQSRAPRREGVSAALVSPLLRRCRKPRPRGSRTAVKHHGGGGHVRLCWCVVCVHGDGAPLSSWTRRDGLSAPTTHRPTHSALTVVSGRLRISRLQPDPEGRGLCSSAVASASQLDRWRCRCGASGGASDCGERRSQWTRIGRKGRPLATIPSSLRSLCPCCCCCRWPCCFFCCFLCPLPRNCGPQVGARLRGTGWERLRHAGKGSASGGGAGNKALRGAVRAVSRSSRLVALARRVSVAQLRAVALPLGLRRLQAPTRGTRPTLARQCVAEDGAAASRLSKRFTSFAIEPNDVRITQMD